jgi:hypothetical protein
MKRSCQRYITSLALPGRLAISAVPRPSAIARMIWCANEHLRRVAVTDKRPHADGDLPAYLDNNSRSHAESLSDSTE